MAGVVFFGQCHCLTRQQWVKMYLGLLTLRRVVRVRGGTPVSYVKMVRGWAETGSLKGLGS